MYSKFKKITDEMERIVALNNPSDEDAERLDELYWEGVRERDDANGFAQGRYVAELDKLNKRFKAVCLEFDPPEDIREAMIDMMFPNSEDGIFEIE